MEKRNEKQSEAPQLPPADQLMQILEIENIDYRKYEKGEIKIQGYLRDLNLVDSRTIFRRNSFTLKTIRLNYKGNKKYKSEGYLCVNCLSLTPPVTHPDHQDALLSCPGNLDLQRGKNMKDLRLEAQFYREVAQRRIQEFGG